MRALRVAVLVALALASPVGRAGLSPAPRFLAAGPARTAVAAEPECPAGHHPARAARRPGCVADAEPACPHGHAWFQERGTAAYRCMSYQLRGTRHSCQGGEAPAVDARGMHRCARPDLDACGAGYAVEHVPGEGLRCVRWL